MSLSNGTGTRARPATVRQTLTAALATVPGKSATPSVPDQATAGAAWVKWIQTTYDGKLELPGTYTYEILLSLPADYLAETVDQGDRFLEALIPALWPVCRIVYAEPVSITFNDRQSAPGLRLRVTTR
jgi:hypothetical protein